MEMFLPLLRGGSCNDDFLPLLPRVECAVRKWRMYKRDEDGLDDLQPVLLHTDMSPRNILVSLDPPEITSVLDWDFAVAGPAEEELTFGATMVRWVAVACMQSAVTHAVAPGRAN